VYVLCSWRVDGVGVLKELFAICHITLLVGTSAERFAQEVARVSQGSHNRRNGRVPAAKHAPRGLFNFLESRHGLAEIIERGAGVQNSFPALRARAVGSGSVDCLWKLGWS